MKTKNKRNLDYYLNLPWTYHIETEVFKGKSYFIIRVNELPGVCTDAEDLNEGMKEIKDAIAGAIELYQAQNRPIPEPIDKDKFKGKIAYRTTTERHYELAKLANQKHLSMSKALDIVFDAGMRNL
jgi:predicted RNase H-like HicB family nuclease